MFTAADKQPQPERLSVPTGPGMPFGTAQMNSPASSSQTAAQRQLRQQLRQVADRLTSNKNCHLNRQQTESVLDEMLNELFGFGPVQPLIDDPTISDILIHGTRQISIRRQGEIEETEVSFSNTSDLNDFVRRLADRSSNNVDQSQPVWEFHLESGVRINVILPPLAPSGPAVSIRRPEPSMPSIEQLIASGTLAPAMADFFILAVRARMNIVVSGEADSGRTTILNCLSRFVPTEQRIVSIEDFPQLRVRPSNFVSLETGPKSGSANQMPPAELLLEHALRLNPDRLIVGDLCGTEAFFLLQSMSTRTPGSISSLNACSPQEAMQKLERLIAITPEAPRPAPVRELIANSVDIVIQTCRLHSGERRVSRICELTGYADGAFRLEDIFVFRRTGESTSGLITGRFFTTGYQPMALQRMTQQGIDISRYRPLFAARELKSTTAPSDATQDN